MNSPVPCDLIDRIRSISLGACGLDLSTKGPHGHGQRVTLYSNIPSLLSLVQGDVS